MSADFVQTVRAWQLQMNKLVNSLPDGVGFVIVLAIPDAETFATNVGSNLSEESVRTILMQVAMDFSRDPGMGVPGLNEDPS